MVWGLSVLEIVYVGLDASYVISQFAYFIFVQFVFFWHQ